MKKLNDKGFTLIELLAVIIIMGILMGVGYTSITRIIENSRKDTFIDNAKLIVNGTSTMWSADNLSCTTTDGSFVSSAVPTGYYYIEVNTASDSVPQVLEKGGKSPWGNRDVQGYVLIKVYDIKKNGPDGVAGNADDVVTRKVEYYPSLSDGVHGVNGTLETTHKQGEKLVRGDLKMSGFDYSKVGVTSGSGASAVITAPKAKPVGGGDTVTASKCVEV